ncbi:phosphomannomutase CpsG [Escherichia coli]|uniref:colanic acid biosynthesis phosphomannomutase CpsG n=1 Tax=Escherichia coli TaxID=562 RepID=UPI000EF94886|nr:colanic acid biosynthesis phosphomannomutase CpsG [Escherichia coli]RLW73791.1 phosphomannomutase CpsG [Escherichia coli]
MKKLTCFKAYDIRGKLGEELNEDVAWRIGRAYGEFLKPKTIVLGGDVRLTSETLKLALAKGLQDAGVDVLDIGMSGTEEIYFATFHLGVDGGIEVTASHNPMDYNGMKLVREEARPISGDTGLRDVQRLAEANDFPPVEGDTGLRDVQRLAEANDFPPVDETKRGRYQQITLRDAYVDHLFGYINVKNLMPLKLVINSGNGAAGPVVDAIEARFKALGAPVELIKVHNTPDGNFPNGIPNPLLPECRDDTRNAVIKHGADMGIAFDGDFDRCFLFDEKGQFIEGYYIVGLLAEAFLEKNPGAKIIHDPRLSWNTLAEAFLEKNPGAKIIHDPRLSWNTVDVVTAAGGTPVMSKTGHAFIKERMRKEDAIYGGEMSAHHYFRDFAYCDSGMIPWLLVAELVCLKGKTLGELVRDRMAAFPASGEINSKLAHPIEAINRVEQHFSREALAVDRTDGISMTFADWRFNLRTSNTEPVVRLNVESRGDVPLMEARTRTLLTLLNE